MFVLFYVFFFFFFQAEDGIRDLYVTGVQTCALPIYRRQTDHRSADGQTGCDAAAGAGWLRRGRHDRRRTDQGARRESRGARRARSEERRVGKECRSRWSPDHEKKKSELKSRTTRHKV